MLNSRAHRFLLKCLVVVAAFGIGALPARAQPAPIDGPWQQIQSNAGACPTCPHSIEGDGAGSIVTANNGRTATVVARQQGDVIEVSGGWPLEIRRRGRGGKQRAFC
jgi:hypothetical protein